MNRLAGFAAAVVCALAPPAHACLLPPPAFDYARVHGKQIISDCVASEATLYCLGEKGLDCRPIAVAGEEAYFCDGRASALFEYYSIEFNQAVEGRVDVQAVLVHRPQGWKTTLVSAWDFGISLR